MSRLGMGLVATGSAELLALAWAGLGLALAWRWRPGSTVRARRAVIHGDRASRSPARSAVRRGCAAVGRRVGRLLGREPSEEAAAELGAAAFAALAASIVAPALAPVIAATAAARAIRRSRRAAARSGAELDAELPEIVDLLAVCVAGGATVAVAVEAVGARSPGRLGRELERVSARRRDGVRLADALGELPVRLGEQVRPLVAALVSADRDGAPLGPTLDRVADELRQLRRRRAEEAARRIPVQLLFPLVTCILPAFALLTVVPVVAGSVAGLGVG